MLSSLRDIGFRDQITRSGLSTPSNIAEGMERRASKNEHGFLDIALGSRAELRTRIDIRIEIGSTDKKDGRPRMAETSEIAPMLVGLSDSINAT